ncbi:DUF7768 domain-containing protein [Oscillibacter ruminantium]|uniref:DUF7768 domain-containing protein n=1 Tax=Oscillibacter ruminantium TaxID=1263547 RepID=UPI003319ABEA
MKRIYVASPYAGDIENNTEFAKNACRFVMNQGHAFFCPHLLYPNILDDDNPKERQLSLDMGLVMLESCDELWCFGERISHGMMAEIEEAETLGIPTRRVMEYEQGFRIGAARNAAPKMQMGTP